MGFDLRDRIERDAHNDQKRGTTKEKRHVESCDQDSGQHAYGADVNRAAEAFGEAVKRGRSANVAE